MRAGRADLTSGYHINKLLTSILDNANAPFHMCASVPDLAVPHVVIDKQRHWLLVSSYLFAARAFVFACLVAKLWRRELPDGYCLPLPMPDGPLLAPCSERNEIITAHNRRKKDLHDMNAAMDNEFSEAENDLKQEFETQWEELKNKNSEDYNVLKLQLEGIIDELERNFEQVRAWLGAAGGFLLCSAGAGDVCVACGLLRRSNGCCWWVLALLCRCESPGAGQVHLRPAPVYWSWCWPPPELHGSFTEASLIRSI